MFHVIGIGFRVRGIEEWVLIEMFNWNYECGSYKKNKSVKTLDFGC
jgi:hypothetical protein